MFAQELIPHIVAMYHFITTPIYSEKFFFKKEKSMWYHHHPVLEWHENLDTNASKSFNPFLVSSYTTFFSSNFCLMLPWTMKNLRKSVYEHYNNKPETCFIIYMNQDILYTWLLHTYVNANFIALHVWKRKVLLFCKSYISKRTYESTLT